MLEYNLSTPSKNTYEYVSQKSSVNRMWVGATQNDTFILFSLLIYIF